MYPKYGLFDFFESNSVEVGRTEDITWSDGEPPSSLDNVIESGVIVKVRWTDVKRAGSGQKRGKGSQKQQVSEKEYSAKLLKVHDDIHVLRQLANDVACGRIKISDLQKLNMDIQGRGKRIKYQKGPSDLSDDSETEVLHDNISSATASTKNPPAAKIRKQKSLEILNKLKEQQSVVSDENDSDSSECGLRGTKKRKSQQGSSDGEMQAMEDAFKHKETGKLRVINMQLRKENRELRQELEVSQNALKTVKYLPDLAKFLQATFPQYTGRKPQLQSSPLCPSRKVLSPLFSPTCNQSPVPADGRSPTVSQQQDNTEKIPGVLVSDVVLARCNKHDPQKYVNDIMTAIYTQEYMASHSLGGTSSKESTKSGLPCADVQQIMDLVKDAFSDETSSRIRACIRQKLNNAEKLLRRKSQLNSPSWASDNQPENN